MSDSKSPQVSRTRLRILAVLSNAVVWIVSVRPPIIIIVIIIIIIIIPWEFFIPTLANGLSPEFDRQQASSGIQNSTSTVFLFRRSRFILRFLALLDPTNQSFEERSNYNWLLLLLLLLLLIFSFIFGSYNPSPSLWLRQGKVQITCIRCSYVYFWWHFSITLIVISEGDEQFYKVQYFLFHIDWDCQVSSLRVNLYMSWPCPVLMLLLVPS